MTKKNLFLILATHFLLLLLASCGGGDTQAVKSDISFESSLPGVTPFVSIAKFKGNSTSDVAAVRYTINGKPGSASKPVSVWHSADALKRNGYGLSVNGGLTVPVFGLYAGYLNNISIQIQFIDQSSQDIEIVISAARYADPNGIYDQPNIVTKRIPGSNLGFDFFYIKSKDASPIVLDSDGEIRWVGIGREDSGSSIFIDNSFVIGDQYSKKIRKLNLDGSENEGQLLANAVTTNFHHTLDGGKHGLLGQFDQVVNGVKFWESVVTEFTTAGVVLRTWDFSEIIGNYMRSQGDDASAFVRPGFDWFHTNSATYDPRDDTLIVSSRENFIIKVDYSTGNIVWILGDPSKYWYSFPSLRAKALQLASGGMFPIGQHATSITSDGLLMIFNNGAESFNQPVGAPRGERRSYSAVSAYSINAPAMTAQEVWSFDHGKSIMSDICSSVYEANGKSLLVNFAVGSGRTKTTLLGLDASNNVLFAFEYKTTSCNTSWNAEPIRFDDLSFN